MRIANEWVECGQCGGWGLDGHDCGEDICCCADPEDNIECENCEGEGGWYQRGESHDSDA